MLAEEETFLIRCLAFFCEMLELRKKILLGKNVPNMFGRDGPGAARGGGQQLGAADFSSDVGRKMFGFSHEELDDSNAYYEGQFKLYQRCGDGTLNNPSIGSKYTGQFENDQAHGRGVKTWPDGSVYEGEWSKGQKHGEGKYVNADDLTYVGQWGQGVRHGQGTQQYSNKDVYVGAWVNGMCSGSGTYHFSDGTRYRGNWSNGRYDGVGVFYGMDGFKERRTYSDGFLVKREMLPPGLPPPDYSKHDIVSKKVLFQQERSEMHRPWQICKGKPSKHLIKRETDGTDLSAPALAPLADDLKHSARLQALAS